MVNKKYITKIILISICLSIFIIYINYRSGQNQVNQLDECEKNAALVNEGFNRCTQYARAWMKFADKETGLIPRNVKDSKDCWNAWDAAADNYPYIVLTSSILMPKFFTDTAFKMLQTEERITSRIGSLPDTYSFSKRDFKNKLIDSNQILFGAAEYMKDGLIPITEWLGKSPWSQRMLSILNDFPKISKRSIDISENWFNDNATVEINGDLLQVLSRTYWFTGKKEYLDWAVKIADQYLNENNLPTVKFNHLRLRDHGCEIISGLCEAYIATYYAMPEKRAEWRPLIHKMLDRILEIGRNRDGLFYNEVNPQNGKILDVGLSDNFGYTLNAYWFISKIDNKPSYREAVVKALSSLNGKYRNYNWESGSADGYADAIEGALNLYNRERIQSTKEWIDSEMKVLWSFQKPDGIIEGWHGDGNFARTSIMYCLWKTQGITPTEWEEKLQVGAIEIQNGIRFCVYHPNGWKGKLKFAKERSKTEMNFPADYPRINEFQQWFSVDKNAKYALEDLNKKTTKIYPGSVLIDGLSVILEKKQQAFFEVRKLMEQ